MDTSIPTPKVWAKTEASGSDSEAVDTAPRAPGGDPLNAAEETRPGLPGAASMAVLGASDTDGSPSAEGVLDPERDISSAVAGGADVPFWDSALSRSHHSASGAEVPSTGDAEGGPSSSEPPDAARELAEEITEAAAAVAAETIGVSWEAGLVVSFPLNGAPWELDAVGLPPWARLEGGATGDGGTTV